MKKITLALFALGIASMSFAQCKSFLKNNCRSVLGDYVPGEEFNAAKLLAGDEAEMSMTFYSGTDYRLLVCSHPILGDVQYQILDESNNVLFDNSNENFAETFDFNLEGTRELKIKISVPANKEATITPQGCVAVMVGRKVAP